MTSLKLNEQTVQSLVGRSIIAANDNWIKLDNGIVIYLEDSEIEVLNS